MRISDWSSDVCASSITAADVRELRARHPGVPVVSYVNTSAAVKAESDACCTSANAVQVVEAVAAESGADTVIFLPDRYLGSWVATRRSEERRVGKEGVSPFRSRWSP